MPGAVALKVDGYTQVVGRRFAPLLVDLKVDGYIRRKVDGDTG